MVWIQKVKQAEYVRTAAVADLGVIMITIR